MDLPVTMLAQASLPDAQLVLSPVLFYAFAALTVLSAWAVVLSQNIVRMSVYLLLTLMGVAGLYFFLSAEFLAAVQLIVYAGGTLILIIFGIMLTSKNPFMQLKTQLWERGLAIAIGLVLAAMLLLSMIHTRLQTSDEAAGAPKMPTIHDIGRALITDYVVPFEIAGVLLLVVMIGAAYMARRRAN